MVYELEIFNNNGSGKTEVVRAEGSGFIVMDSVDGALFCIVNAQGSPSHLRFRRVALHFRHLFLMVAIIRLSYRLVT